MLDQITDCVLILSLSHFLVIKDQEAKTSRILVEPHLVDSEFCRAWIFYFCRSGRRVVAVEQLLDSRGLLSSPGARS